MFFRVNKFTWFLEFWDNSSIENMLQKCFSVSCDTMKFYQSRYWFLSALTKRHFLEHQKDDFAYMEEDIKVILIKLSRYYFCTQSYRNQLSCSWMRICKVYLPFSPLPSTLWPTSNRRSYSIWLYVFLYVYFFH